MRRPRFNQTLAAGLAAIGQLTVIEPFEISGPRAPSGLSPAARARVVEARIHLRAGIVVPSGPILLVDDTLRTGWTMTISGALLREAGATAILPLVVHQRP
jgi:ATP-dependent DNA helicase RecQ